VSQRLLTEFRTDLDSIGGNELQLRDTDEAEHAAQIGFEMFERCCRRVGAVEAAA
jgi:hypothetical protein